MRAQQSAVRTAVSVGWGNDAFPSRPAGGYRGNWTWPRPSKINKLVHAGPGSAAGWPEQQDPGQQRTLRQNTGTAPRKLGGEQGDRWTHPVISAARTAGCENCL